MNVDCPRCGCNRVHWIRRPQPGWFSGGGKAQCDHCRLIFTVSATVDAAAPPVDHHEPIVPGVRPAGIQGPTVGYQVLLCPMCGTPKPRVTHTIDEAGRKMRHLKCRSESCGHRFKLAEQHVRPPLR